MRWKMQEKFLFQLKHIEKHNRDINESMRQLDNKLSRIDVNIVRPEVAPNIKKYDKHSNIPDMLKCYICEGKY